MRAVAVLDKRLENAAQFMAGGYVVEAEIIYQDMMDNADALSGLAAIALASGKHDEAESLINRAIKIEPGNGSHHFSLATILKAAGRADITLFEKAHTLTESDEIAFAYACELVDAQHQKQAIVILEKLDKTDVLVQMKLAQAHIECSELDEACSIYSDLIKKYPAFLPAYLHFAQNTTHDKKTLCRPERLEHFLTRLSTKTEQEPAIHSALAKVYEDLCEYDQAFTHYKACNDKNKAGREYNNQAADKTLADVRRYYAHDRFDSVVNTDKHCPLIFICGMPRSGSTLIEQVLASHSAIETRGETNNIGEQIISLAGGAIPESSDAATKKFIEEYIGETSSRYVVDKMPGNYHYLGLMYQLFPQAKFIITSREAVNNCFSCYATNFATGYLWAMDLDDCAKEYKRHVEYASHWPQVLPAESIMTVRYEDMVAGQKTCSRKILKWLGLKWEPACEEFYKLKRNVKTASLSQVVRPIYTSSLDRASNFKKHLTQLRSSLDDQS